MRAFTLRKTAYMRGKALEMAILIGRDTNRGANRFYNFIVSIETFKQTGTITKNLVKLVQMKESLYREQLIKSGIWTKEVYEDIRSKVIVKVA